MGTNSILQCHLVYFTFSPIQPPVGPTDKWTCLSTPSGASFYVESPIMLTFVRWQKKSRSVFYFTRSLTQISAQFTDNKNPDTIHLHTAQSQIHMLGGKIPFLMEKLDSVIFPLCTAPSEQGHTNFRHLRASSAWDPSHHSQVVKGGIRGRRVGQLCLAAE